MKIKILTIVPIFMFVIACSSAKPVEPVKEVKPEVTPVEVVPVKPVINLEGEYKVEGKGAGARGAKYEGTLTVTKDGENYKFEMKMRARKITGKGTLADKTLTINWNKKDYVYEVQDDGRILSKWGEGKGEENYIPVKK